jgi:hypothetical protein
LETVIFSISFFFFAKRNVYHFMQKNKIHSFIFNLWKIYLTKKNISWHSCLLLINQSFILTC